jgi:1,2-diacylglycerol 3-alpha-glucosyltransferase
MRAAIFSECYTPVANGVVTSIVTLRDMLRTWGHTVYVFAPGTPQPDDVDVFRLPELPFPRHPFHLARPFPRLPVDFDSLNIDVIHCQHPFTIGRLGAETARRHGLPLVYTAHSLYDEMAASSKSRFVRKVGQPAARGFVRRFCARADAVIVPSRHTRDALIADGVHATFDVVPTGVPCLRASPNGRARVRQQLDLSEDAPLLLYLGRLGPEKRVDMLLRMVVALRDRDLPAPLNRFRLAIVGDGQCRNVLEDLAAELNVQERVVFTGTQSHADIADWYAAADVFTLASPAETQGLVLIEAMQMNVPCVAVDQGGPVEIIADGQTGRLVEFDAHALADAVEELLRDSALRQRFAAQARKTAQIYTPEAMAQGVLEVYERVAGR